MVLRARGNRYEISSTGYDPYLQGVGSDPDGSGYAVGVRVPTTPSAKTGTRYMFMLAKARITARQVARLVGIRQMATIGVAVPNDDQGSVYPLELQVTSPFWKFTDGNISWHLRRLPPGYQATFETFSSEGEAYLDSQTPALIYSSAIGEGGGYLAPYRVPGVPLIGQLGTWYDLRWNWRADQAYYSLDAEIEGPCEIALYASVKQTNTETRPALVLPGSLPGGTGCIPPEDAFVANFPNAVYWRVAGDLIFQEEEFYAESPGQTECWAANDGPRPILPRGRECAR